MGMRCRKRLTRMTSSACPCPSWTNRGFMLPDTRKYSQSFSDFSVSQNDVDDVSMPRVATTHERLYLLGIIGVTTPTSELKFRDIS